MNKNMLYCRYYRIAGITVQLDSDLPIAKNTFQPKFKDFEAKGPGKDTVIIRHHFFLPEFDISQLGEEVYRNFPWAIYRKGRFWVYLGISRSKNNKKIFRMGVFNNKYTRGIIYNSSEDCFRKGNAHSLILFHTDQIFLCHLLVDRQGCFMHSCGISYKKKGLLFLGNSRAGKSTTARLFKGKAKILCDDRMIIRQHKGNFKIYGTWLRGEVLDPSGDSAPLKAIFFLKKSKNNMLVRIEDKKEIMKRLLACLVKPLTNVSWWEKTLILLEEVVNKVPCYEMHFDKSGDIVKKIDQLLLL